MQTILMPNFTKRGGLITVIAQDYNTHIILMVAHTDKKGFLETVETGKAVYFSTSRNERWKKGETSGNFQEVRKIFIDCDGDAVVYQVIQKGAGACHTGKPTCFYRSLIGSSLESGEGSLKIRLMEVSSNITY